MERALVEFMLKEDTVTKKLAQEKRKFKSLTSNVSKISSVMNKSVENFNIWRGLETAKSISWQSKIIYEPYHVLTRNARPFSASIDIQKPNQTSNMTKTS